MQETQVSPWSGKIPQALGQPARGSRTQKSQLLSLCTLAPGSAAREAATRRRPRITAAEKPEQPKVKKVTFQKNKKERKESQMRSKFGVRGQLGPSTGLETMSGDRLAGGEAKAQEEI